MLPVAKVAAAYAAVVVPATGCREWRVGGATEEELFGDWVHCRDQDQQRSRALVGMAEDRADLLLQEGDLADHQPTQHEHPGKSQAEEHRVRAAAVRPSWNGPKANPPTVQTSASARVAG
jgi:hypothetical protein